ncbi:MAG: iron-sulfur cluster assembly protein [Planctomycetes bacterium]|nr:iron-sulfur cluster assembly protein [Planctomycetota bacterium]
MTTRDEVIDEIRKVFDPEIPVNVVDLGLIYDCAVDPMGKVDVRMTLTTPGCPSARAIPDEVRARVAAMEGVKGVNVAVVFDPPWHPRLITAEGRRILGIPEGEFT